MSEHHQDLPTPAPGDDELAQARQALVPRITRFATSPGLHQHPALPGLLVFRADGLNGSVCGVYEPSVALIVQGSKRVVLGADTLVYDSGHFLVTSLDLPAVATILEASPERPYLALVLRLDLREIAGLMLSGQLPVFPALAAPARLAREPVPNRAMAIGRVTLPLLDAFGRLLDLLAEPEGLPVLAPLVQREIHYRLLMGEQIARAIDSLKTRYAEPLRVEDLAREVRMSVSTFHHQFKALTAMSPLQYQKQMRLTEARRLMLSDNLDASTAAYRVGYESPSQFSREYSRQFGAPPVRDIAGLRAAQPEAVNA